MKILNIDDIHVLTSQRLGRKVVVGGCFDVIHIGHLSFFTQAKKERDTLIVLLESDESIGKWKGKNRPIHTQKERAEILSAFSLIDYIVLLPEMKEDQDYDDLLLYIRPDVIVTTKGDIGIHHKKRQSKLTGSRLVEVPRISGKSSSEIVKLLLAEI